MRLLRFVGTACVVLCLAALGPAAQDKKPNAEKLVGTWELVKSESNVPPGATIQFTKDGKIKMTVKVMDKTVTAEATYKIDGDKITTTMKAGGMEKTETATIKTLTDTKLVVVDDKGKTDEFKKK